MMMNCLPERTILSFGQKSERGKKRAVQIIEQSVSDETTTSDAGRPVNPFDPSSSSSSSSSQTGRKCGRK